MLNEIVRLRDQSEGVFPSQSGPEDKWPEMMPTLFAPIASQFEGQRGLFRKT
jgi:hypothetical protein